MTQTEYKQKKHECWEEIAATLAVETENLLCKAIAYSVFDRAFALGKEEKDAEEITIDKEEYKELCKYRRYAANWAHGLTVCPICGEYNPSGCICANCDNNKDWNK